MQTINTLFLTGSHFCPDQEEMESLEALYPQIRVTSTSMSNYSLEQLQQAHIIVGLPKPGDLKHAVNLHWLQTPSSGVSQYVDSSLYAGQPILLTNARGTYGRQIADHVIGEIIAFNHNLLRYHEQMKIKLWKRYFPTKDLWESTLLIIGLGDIGTQLALRAKAHGLRVLAIKRTAAPKPSYVDELGTQEDLDSFLMQADYVVLCAASTDQTEHLLDERRIALLPAGSYVFNVGRGNLLDEQALVRALQSGRIKGAGLDVTTIEPLPQDHVLWTLDNVLITPHASGLSPSDPHQVFSLFLKNLDLYLQNKPLINCVDFARTY
ncbi:MAG: D-2-hydroxyacid dehydrogenase [Spirochaetales bacterium]|nr:D-2-hydroxyacid dehydrogenase [Spirochaetales bacterium]